MKTSSRSLRCCKTASTAETAAAVGSRRDAGSALRRRPALDLEARKQPRSQPLRRAGRTREFSSLRPVCAQALSKVERGHHQDLQDVREMASRGLINASGAWDDFVAI